MSQLRCMWICIFGFIMCYPVNAKNLDVILSLDNSGSMRHNDPQKILHQVVKTFAGKLGRDDRFGIVTFDQTPHVLLPLSSTRDDTFQALLTQALDKIDYTGKLTDIPGGLEEARHLIELQGRREAEAVIVLVTDGAIDLGSDINNSDRKHWLWKSILPAAKNQNLRLYGVTLTAGADVELIQSMAEATGGEYYRLLQAKEINACFDAILKHILSLQPKQLPATSTIIPAISQEPVVIPVTKPSPVIEQIKQSVDIEDDQFFIASGVGIIFLVSLILFWWYRNRLIIPSARLVNLDSQTGTANYYIDKRLTQIDNFKHENSHTGPSPIFVEYRHNGFYIVDLGNLNGTFINDEPVPIHNKKGRLIQNGDTLRVGSISFRFDVGNFIRTDGNVASTSKTIRNQTEPPVPGVRISRVTRRDPPIA